MAHTACATTATATTLRPCTQPAAASAGWADKVWANSSSAAAEGKVKPTHAASAPQSPARVMPSAMPSWLLAGPGRNWHSASSSE